MPASPVSLPIATPEGIFLASYSGRGLAALHFPGFRSSSTAASEELPAEAAGWHQQTTDAVLEVLAGKEPRSLPPLDLSTGTEFQRRVWSGLRRIPLGRTVSYARLAERIGHPRAARAVGGACGANPIPLLVPCHRVLAAGGKIGGFGGGLDWKRKLLSREQAG